MKSVFLVDDSATMLMSLKGTLRGVAPVDLKAGMPLRLVIDDAGGMDFDAALSLEARVQGAMSRGHDFAEGVAAFLQKRPAVFTDR
mgnify:CR=1 FL=1